LQNSPTIFLKLPTVYFDKKSNKRSWDFFLKSWGIPQVFIIKSEDKITLCGKY